MVIKLSKFGNMLISRPAGREAYLSAKAYLLSEKPEKIEIDFKDVKVLTPSWIDEFVTLLQSEYPEIKIVFHKSNNQSVTSSLQMLNLSALSF